MTAQAENQDNFFLAVGYQAISNKVNEVEDKLNANE